MDETTDEAVQEPQANPDEALARAQACDLEIQEVLAKHDCRIIAVQDRVEYVGTEGGCVQLRAGLRIIPN